MSITEGITPVNKYLLCSAVEEKKGVLILKEEKFKTVFDVLDAGDCEGFERGDRIFIEKYREMPIEFDDETYFLIKEEHVLAVLS